MYNQVQYRRLTYYSGRKEEEYIVFPDIDRGEEKTDYSFPFANKNLFSYIYPMRRIHHFALPYKDFQKEVRSSAQLHRWNS